MEIAYAALKKKHFYNRGVLNGPLCPVYGIGMILILTFFSSLRESLVFLAIGSAVIATILEFFTGALMEKLFKKRWWDYSDYKYNLGGYVCIPFSALWGVGAALTLRFIHPLIHMVISRVPALAGQIILIAGLVILAMDFISVWSSRYRNTTPAWKSWLRECSRFPTDWRAPFLPELNDEWLRPIPEQRRKALRLRPTPSPEQKHVPARQLQPSSPTAVRSISSYGCSLSERSWEISLRRSSATSPPES